MSPSLLNLCMAALIAVLTLALVSFSRDNRRKKTVLVKDTYSDDLETDYISEEKLFNQSRQKLLTEYLYKDGPVHVVQKLKVERFRIRLTRNGWTAFEHNSGVNFKLDSEECSELRRWTYDNFDYIAEDGWRKTAEKIPYTYLIYWDYRVAPYFMTAGALMEYMETQMDVTSNDYRVEDDSYPKYITNMPPGTAAEIYACRDDYD